MKTREFNKIETIRTDASIANKSEAYLAACDEFEVEASNFATNQSFISKKSAEEVSLHYDAAKKADNEYSIYAETYAAECWLEKAFNCAR